MEILAALLAAFSVLALGVWALGGHRRAVRARLATLAPGWNGETQSGAEGRGPSVTQRVSGSLGQRLLRLLPTPWAGTLRGRLAAAGKPVTPAGYMALTALGLALAVGVDAVVLAPMVGVSARFWLLAIAIAGLGLYLPHIWLSRAVHNRRARILSQLPDALDLMTTCVEAGLGLDAAMSQVAVQLGGPFGEELQLTLSEIALGRERMGAMDAMAERVDLPELTSFVQALVQADHLGVSLGQVLRVQADVMRVKHRQRVEQLVYQAPVKMLFPLVFCIFPAMFVVILGPALIELKDGLVGG